MGVVPEVWIAEVMITITVPEAPTVTLTEGFVPGVPPRVGVEPVVFNVPEFACVAGTGIPKGPASEVAVIVPVPVAARDPPAPTVSAVVLEPAAMLLKARLVVTESAEQIRTPELFTLL